MNTIVITVSGRRVLNELVWTRGVQANIVVLLLLLFPLQFPHPNVSCLVASLPPGCQPCLSLKLERCFTISSQSRDQRDQASYLSINFYMGYLNIKTIAWIIRVRVAPVLIDQSIGRHSECHSVGLTTVRLVAGPELRQVTFCQLNPAVGKTI